MYESPVPLPQPARASVAASLQARLADAIDLHSQIKVAHWNVRGPHFAAYHPLFETFAVGLAAQIDLIAERAVTLGATVNGTARYVAASSGIPDYDAATRRDLDHARALVARFGTFVARLHESRNTANECGDTDTVDLLTGVITEFEKHGWFLQATLDEA